MCLRTLGGFFPGDAQLAGKIFAYRLRYLGQFALTAIPVPAHRRPGDQHLRALLTAAQPSQQLLGQGDPAGPQQVTPGAGPRPIGNRRAGQVDDRIQLIIRLQFFKPGDAAHLATAQFGYLIRPAAPNRKAMALAEPELAQVPAYQTGAACQQYMHGCVLAECGSGLFLEQGTFLTRRSRINIGQPAL
ncbi:hypothetical protein D3C76_1231160 [compost metagenome]